MRIKTFTNERGDVQYTMGYHCPPSDLSGTKDLILDIRMIDPKDGRQTQVLLTKGDLLNLNQFLYEFLKDMRMAHKHKLKFIRKGVEFIGIAGWPYRETWDFNCKYCPHTYRADRNVMIKLMTRKTT